MKTVYIEKVLPSQGPGLILVKYFEEENQFKVKFHIEWIKTIT